MGRITTPSVGNRSATLRQRHCGHQDNGLAMLRLRASRSLVRWAPAMFAAIVACGDDSVAPVAAIPPDPNPTRTIAVPFCADAAPIWAAFQDGDGAWMRAFPVVRGDRVTFRRDLSSNHAAIATLSQ